MGMMNDVRTHDLFRKAEQAGMNAHHHETVWLDHAVDLNGFRRTARHLLARQIPPEHVQWFARGAAAADLFANAANDAAEHDDATLAVGEGEPAPAINVPPEFLPLAETVVLHRDVSRFGLLYRLLWRLVHEPGLRHDALDADFMRAQHMAQAVRRDMHKMKAFVRFRTVQDEAFRSNPLAGPLHVAWFEPEHHIVAAIAPFFVRRFTQMRWAVLTPECSLYWDYAGPRSAGQAGQAGQASGALQIGPGALKEDAPPPDAGEQLWLTYYQSIFNPARLKLKAMQKEMPRRYWKNLPEAQFISSLAAQSSQRQTIMIEQSPTTPRRRIPVAGTPAATPPVSATSQARPIAPGEQVSLALDLEPVETPRAAESASITAPTHVTPPDLATLNAATQRCRECPIGEHATQAVCGEGPSQARLMVVGEQPGDQEDLRGRPFVGPAGQLFDRAVAQLGWARERLFVTNAVKHFKYEPRGRRRMHKTPSQQEAAACRHWLESEIDLVKPEAVLALGATAASSLLGRRVAVMSERGQWFTRADGLRVLVTLHPSALLRTPPEYQADAYEAWLKDLRVVQELALAE
jgi:uracil-DNA glycosylase